MPTLRAEFEITETGEKFVVDGFDIKSMIEKARQEAGDFVSVAVRAIAVLSVIVICGGCATTAAGVKSRHTVEPGPWGREDITTAPQSRAPLSYDEGYKQLTIKEG